MNKKQSNVWRASHACLTFFLFIRQKGIFFAFHLANIVEIKREKKVNLDFIEYFTCYNKAVKEKITF